jgi:hypothetical protein
LFYTGTLPIPTKRFIGLVFLFEFLRLLFALPVPCFKRSEGLLSSGVAGSITLFRSLPDFLSLTMIRIYLALRLHFLTKLIKVCFCL